MKLQTTLAFQYVGTVAFAVIAVLGISGQATKTDLPRVFLADARRLQEVKHAFQAKDKTYDADSVFAKLKGMKIEGDDK